MTHGLEKSDRLTVPKKLSNKAEQAVAEKAEGRSLAKGNPLQDDTTRMQGRRRVNSALERIRQAAERDRKVKFTSLLHHKSTPWTCFGRRTSASSGEPHRVSTERPGGTTERT